MIMFAILPIGRAGAADCQIDPDWKVDAVRLPREQTRKASDYVELGDVIAVKSANLTDLRKCLKTAGQQISLFLNGMPVQGLAEFPLSVPADNEAWFTLAIAAKSQAVWRTLLGGPGVKELRDVTVSLGADGGFPIKPSPPVPLRPLPPVLLTLWAVIFVLGVVSFFWFAAKSNLLRGGTPGGGRTFSIARSQAAWWFFIVLGSYLLIGLTTGDYANSLNQTALTLLGIAAATHLGSAVVDASKDTPEEDAAKTDSKTALRAHVLAADAIGTAPDPAVVTKLAKLNGQSQGWLKDVLSDADGIDFHRFQMLAWTFVLGIIFVINVWQGLAMPDFNATLLGLLGLSAGTYVGLKIPEATK
jgi:hypothetical protein